MAFGYDPSIVNGALGRVGAQYRIPGQVAAGTPPPPTPQGWNTSFVPDRVAVGTPAPATPAGWNPGVGVAPGPAAQNAGFMQQAMANAKGGGGGMSSLFSGAPLDPRNFKQAGPNPYLQKVYNAQNQDAAQDHARRNAVVGKVLSFFTGGLGGAAGGMMGGGGGGGLGGVMGG